MIKKLTIPILSAALFFGAGTLGASAMMNPTDAVFNDLYTWKEYIVNTGNMNERNSDEQTLLHCAIKNHNEELFRFLITEKDVDLEARDKFRRTPMHEAAQYGNYQTVALLADACMDSNPEGSGGQTVNSLPNAYVGFNAKDVDGLTPLHYAAFSGNIDTIAWFLSASKANVNITNDYLWTPLHLAARLYDKNLVLLLLEFGADVNAKDNYEWTPLHWASFTNNHIETFNTLLAAKGIDVNAKGNGEWTPLHCAADNGNITAINALTTAKGINLNEQNNNGCTPLYIAAEKGNIEVVRALLAAKGIAVNAKNQFDMTPLHIAAQKSNIDVVRALLTAKGIAVNAKNQFGNTPLHFAAYHGNVEVVEALLATEGINVNAQNVHRRTPLDLVVGNGNEDIIRLLLNNGAVKTQNNGGLLSTIKNLLKKICLGFI